MRKQIDLKMLGGVEGNAVEPMEAPGPLTPFGLREWPVSPWEMKPPSPLEDYAEVLEEQVHGVG